MFDSIGHGRPFIASDLEFFKEFADQGLGLAIKRTPYHFSSAIKKSGFANESFRGTSK